MLFFSSFYSPLALEFLLGVVRRLHRLLPVLPVVRVCGGRLLAFASVSFLWILLLILPVVRVRPPLFLLCFVLFCCVISTKQDGRKHACSRAATEERNKNALGSRNTNTIPTALPTPPPFRASSPSFPLPPSPFPLSCIIISHSNRTDYLADNGVRDHSYEITGCSQERCQTKQDGV